MAKFKVVVLKHGYPSTGIERRIVEGAGGEFIDTEALSEEQGLALCADADAVLVRWLKITPEIIRRLRRCKIIVRYGVGTDNVDVDAATAAGIMVGHVPDYCMDEVSAHAMALWLACVRQVVTIRQKISKGGWDLNPAEKMHRVAGKTFGLVGLGHIGQAMTRKLSGWGMRLVATDPYLEPAAASELGVELVSLEALCRSADHISLHLPLLPETRHLISRNQFEWMKPGVILINTARGPVLDTEALLAALNSGRVIRAGLDVLEQEPPLDSRLRQHPRVVLTDHIAWYSEESQAELRQTAAEEVVAVCRGGLPKSLMNPEVLRVQGRLEKWTPSSTARWQLKRQAAISSSGGSGPPHG